MKKLFSIENFSSYAGCQEAGGIDEPYIKVLDVNSDTLHKNNKKCPIKRGVRQRNTIKISPRPLPSRLEGFFKKLESDNIAGPDPDRCNRYTSVKKNIGRGASYIGQV